MQRMDLHSHGDCNARLYGGRESSTRCNFRRHMQIEKAPANQENNFVNLTKHTLQMLTTQTNKEMHCKCFWFFGCVVSICSAFFYLVVLWAFAAHVLSNWRSYFLNLQVFFFLFAVRWALLATVRLPWMNNFGETGGHTMHQKHYSMISF